MVHSIVQDLVTLFVVINPIGKVPLFIILASHLTLARQRAVALRAVLIAGLVLLFFLVFGQPVLGALGIELVSVQIAGSLILLIIGLRMVLEEARDIPVPASGNAEDIAVFPLAMPFIAGPGAIVTVMVLTDDDVHTLRDQMETGAAVLAVLVLTLVCLFGANQMNRILGRTGVNVISRVMGLILSSFAAQSLLAGLRLVWLR
jgi:multiple antibiotic resistance protein